MEPGFLALSAYLFAVSLVLSLLLTPLAARLGRAWGVVDEPGPRKVHDRPIPLAGGWALLASLSVVTWGHLLAALALRGSPLLDRVPMGVHFAERIPELARELGPVYAGALAVFVLGLVDDLRGVSVRGRLACQTAVAAAIVAFGPRPGLGHLPEWAAVVVGIVWIVGITNAFNLIDGLDGLSAGVALIASTALLAVMGLGNQPDLMFFAASLSGILAGFLRSNLHPARVFLGSAGSLLLGFLLAIATMTTTYQFPRHENWLMPLLTPLFILAIPIYDTASVVLIRILQKRPVALGDQSHFHHRLLRIGFTHRTAVLFIWLVAAAVALSAVGLVRSTLFQSVLSLVQIATVLAILVIAERVAGRPHE